MTKKIKTTFNEFFSLESASSIILLGAAVLALIWANTPWAEYYANMLSMTISVAVPGVNITKPAVLWVNDGLMAIFFLLIGLEVKRELLFGQLKGFKAAITPVLAAMGGAATPATIFLFFNNGTAYIDGWAIPMATDIAFAVGVLALFGNRAPAWAKIFLLAFAVVDDLIAIVVIALFYTSQLNLAALSVAGASVVALVALNLLGVRGMISYFLVAIVLWVATLKSGIHATLAGVILGLTIPASTKSTKEDLLLKTDMAKGLLEDAFATSGKTQAEYKQAALNFFSDTIKEIKSPLHRLEHALHPWVAYLIMPVFALFNAGIAVDLILLNQAMSSTLFWGIALGLIFGNPIGVFSMAYLARGGMKFWHYCAKICRKPTGDSWNPGRVEARH